MWLASALYMFLCLHQSFHLKDVTFYCLQGGEVALPHGTPPRVEICYFVLGGGIAYAQLIQ